MSRPALIAKLSLMPFSVREEWIRTYDAIQSLPTIGD